MGIERSTFLIDENGIVLAVWNKVKVTGHTKAVLKTIQEL
jgi:peroxiredoxin Q/BCP